MSIPNYDYMTPTGDEFLEYDFDENRYVPTLGGVKANAYVNLEQRWGSKSNAQCYLDLLSRVVNEVILGYKDQKYRLKMQYWLAHSKQARLELIKLFNDAVWYNRRDGGFMMAYNSGANLNQGKLIEFGVDKAVSSIAHQEIKNTVFGTRYLTVDINEKEDFSTLTDLLTYLFSENYITQDQADIVTESEDLNDLPHNDDYYLIQLPNEHYLFTNIKSINKYVSQMKKYNANGDW